MPRYSKQTLLEKQYDLAKKEKKENSLHNQESLLNSILGTFFIAESMLFVSYASAITFIEHSNYFHVLICFLGGIVSISFLVIFKENIKVLNDIKNSLDIKSESTIDYVYSFLPIIFLFIWILVFILEKIVTSSFYN